MIPLRQPFLQDLQIRNYAPKTILAYLAGVVRFVTHFRQSPELLGAAHVRDFQLQLLQQGVSWSLFNQTVCAWRFLDKVTLPRPDVVAMIPYAKKAKTQPVVLSVRIYWRPAPICSPSRSCSATAISRPPWATPTSAPPRFTRPVPLDGLDAPAAPPS